ncbi:MAG: DUF1569 domain-containing protein [Vicinamibacterales bacterium]
MNDYLDRCRRILEHATASIPADKAAQRVDGRWSIVEIVEHLQRTYSRTAKGFERCLENDGPNATPISWRGRLNQFVIVKLGYFPPGRQSPKQVLPTGDLDDLPSALDQVRRDLAWLDRAAIQVRHRLGSGKMLDHPVLGALSVDEWLRFHWIHTRHHEKQIRARAAG